MMFPSKAVPAFLRGRDFETIAIRAGRSCRAGALAATNGRTYRPPDTIRSPVHCISVMNSITKFHK